jgi:hypothetical protein
MVHRYSKQKLKLCNVKNDDSVRFSRVQKEVLYHVSFSSQALTNATYSDVINQLSCAQLTANTFGRPT